jgi:hypothetical protein
MKSKFDYKPVFSTLDRLIKLGKFDEWYDELPQHTTEDRIIRYATIAKNEFTYVVHLAKKDGLQERMCNSNPSLSDCVKAINEFWFHYQKDSKIIEYSIESRARRISHQQSARYQKLKRYFVHAMPVKACCKCGSRAVQMDHIQPHQSFKHLDLAYDLNNLQWLCATHNSEKGPSTADYRTEEQKQQINDYVENFLGGNSIIEP